MTFGVKEKVSPAPGSHHTNPNKVLNVAKCSFHTYTDIRKLTWRQSHDSASFLTTSNTESTSSAPETDKIVKHFHSGSEGYKVGVSHASLP